MCNHISKLQKQFSELSADLEFHLRDQITARADILTWVSYIYHRKRSVHILKWLANVDLHTNFNRYSCFFLIKIPKS